MKTEFIPYEQALELKELGFDEECLGYHNLDPYLPKPTFNLVKPFDHEWCLPAPLFQQAFCFFREKYNLIHEILLDRTSTPKYCYQLYRYKDFGDFEEIKINVSDWFLYRTYEEAELECLIKLIEIVKNEK